MVDEIIQELWRIRDELAREANYDVHTLCRKLRKNQASSPAKIVDRSSHYGAADNEAGADNEYDSHANPDA
jgi:hypothetical protein